MTQLAVKLECTRERFLIDAAHIINNSIIGPHMGSGWKAPAFRVSIGFTSARRSKALACCYVKRMSKDNVNEIFITPVVDDTVRVLGALTHELIHAADNCESGHKGHFKRVARLVGLEGKLTATTEGERITKQFHDLIIDKFGNIPHAALKQGATTKKKEGTRMLKVVCSACDLTFRTAKKWITQITPKSTCPCCGQRGKLKTS